MVPLQLTVSPTLGDVLDNVGVKAAGAVFTLGGVTVVVVGPFAALVICCCDVSDAVSLGVGELFEFWSKGLHESNRRETK